jgi:hypothetical protein
VTRFVMTVLCSLVVFGAGRAEAQEFNAMATDTVAALTPSIAVAATAAAETAAVGMAVEAPPARRPASLFALYGGFAALQAYDAYSTLAAVKAGGVELNPVLRGVAKKPAAMIALKSAVTVASIAAADRLWKKGRKKHAVVMLAATSAAMTVVAINNHSVLSKLR